MDIASVEPPPPLKSHYRTEISDDSLRLLGRVCQQKDFGAALVILLSLVLGVGVMFDELQKAPSPGVYLGVLVFFILLTGFISLVLRLHLYREEFLLGADGFCFRCGYFSLVTKRTVPLHELKSFREYSFEFRRKHSSRTVYGIEAETIGLPLRFSQDGYRDEMNWLLFHLNVLLAKLSPHVDFSTPPSDCRFELETEFDTMKFTQRNFIGSGRQWTFSPNEIVRTRFFSVFSWTKRFAMENLREVRITVRPGGFSSWTQTAVSTDMTRSLQFIDTVGKITCSVDELTEGEAHWIVHLLREHQILITAKKDALRG